MTADLLGISVTGIRVTQAALSTTGHNISNAGVDGYSRQKVNIQTNPATLTGAGYVGNGANVSSIERIVNDFVTGQLRSDTSLFKDLDSYHGNVIQLDNLLSDTSTGLSSGLESFFASMQNGLDDPTSIPARQLILSEAENLADRFNTLYGRFQAIESGVNDSLKSAVSQVNALVNNVAELNLKISNALGLGDGAQPNDLLDQRDEALRQLSEFISIQTYDQGAGQINVVVGSGQNLVVGIEARQLQLQQSENDVSKFDVIFQGNVGGQVITNLISGGEIGGLLRFRDESITQVYNDFGRIAVVMADTFNKEHAKGITLDNEFGGSFFYDVNNAVLAANRVIGNSNNAEPSDRQMRLNIVDSAKLTSSNYEVEIDQGGLFHVYRSDDEEEVATGILSGSYPYSVSFDGMELVFDSGSFQGGDAFKLQPVKTGGRDFSSSLVNASSLAFASPVLTDATIGNSGSGVISAGEVLSLEDHSGNTLPLLANAGVMDPPLVVKFTSPTSYDILDNSDPGAPVQLQPPIRNQRFVVGLSNELFSTDPGATQVSSNGMLMGLPVGSVPTQQALADFNFPVNGYPAEAVSINFPPVNIGGQPVTETLFTTLNASAKEIASSLNNVSGVSANAFNYMEISNLQVTGASPLQFDLNGVSLLEYETDPISGLQVLAANVPDPASETNAFNDYVANRINGNATLQRLGFYAQAGNDANNGLPQLRVFASEGDDFKFSFVATAGETVSISDGDNPTVALTGAGPALKDSIAVGGKLDIRLAEGLTLSTFPPNSMLFGDTSASNFAQSSYVGIQAAVSGIPDSGDTFTLNFNMDAASDNRNALSLVNLSSGASVGGIASYSESYGALVESVGIDTASAKINADAGEQVLHQSTQMRASISGVNLDEEAANLIRFEQMYAANTQVISVARELFDRLINSF